MDRKWTYLLFALGGLTLTYVLSRSVYWGWDYLGSTDFAGDYVGKPSEALIDGIGLLLAAVVTVLALRNEQLFALADQVTEELSKVTWPTREETFAATIVVIVTVIVSSIFLGVFDLLWSWVARLIYG